MPIKVIGDVHGKYPLYLEEVIKSNEVGYSTVQVGDMGFSYNHLSKVDPVFNKFIGGNHDNYYELAKLNLPHNLGDFGLHAFPEAKYGLSPPFFFIRGAFSIDKAWRIEGRDWWQEEELTRERMQEAFNLYKEVKPEVVISHDFPNCFILEMHGDNRFKNRTSDFLQCMFDEHKPVLWIGGHHHLSFKKKLTGTTFACINELETVII